MIHHKQDVGFPSLNKEMALFEATGNKSKYLNLVDQALSSILATSVEAERAFSAIGLFKTKLRSRLNESSVDSLMVSKAFFQIGEQLILVTNYVRRLLVYYYILLSTSLFS